ncbi:hypothetical protein GCM10009117_23630 [Gangjinia marincola]|uniref:Thioredoxin domain-containing protein n=1 Tax=Gangjinia marincola TaxID=578463 RepID=A0ABP3XYY5_9FLAO
MKKVAYVFFSLALIACGSQQKTTQNTAENVSPSPTPPSPPTVIEVEQEASIEEVVDKQLIEGEAMLENGMLVGEGNIEQLTKAPFNTWFEGRANAYTPEADVLEQIAQNINDYNLTLYMGTWCGDSKRETPKIYSLLEKTGYNMDNLTFYAVNRQKTIPGGLPQGSNVKRVPTLIFYKDGQEVNRFVEYPQETLAKDILKIVSGEDYKNSYAE